MKIDVKVLAVLSTLMVDDEARLVRMVPLDRSMYLAVNKVLEALGGKWNKRSKAHVFEEPPSAVIEAALLHGEVTTARDIGFFPTPPALATQLVEMAGVRDYDQCLEPSAGTGSIVRALLAAGGNVTCVERDPKMRAALAAWPGIVERTITVLGLSDCLDLLPGPRFDRVVMNPPFARVGQGDHLDHVRHAYQMVRVDGALASVLPAGVTFREDRRHRAFREWVEQVGGVITPLPDGSFKASGTMVRTCVLRVAR